MEEINYVLILLSSFAATSSPGPGTLAIVGTSMRQGRTQGLFLALGVLTGSIFWSAAAAFGLAAILLTNTWLFEVLRYIGATYLLYLAFMSLRSALSASEIELPKYQSLNVRQNYLKGLLIHITNPKAILFFAALYSVGVPAQAQVSELVSIIFSVGLLSATIFMVYAFLFSSRVVSNIYLKAKPIFEGIFALFFGLAGMKLLAGKFES